LLFVLGTGERIGANVAQEFLLGRYTHRRHQTTDALTQ
jgi:hypothetical protein